MNVRMNEFINLLKNKWKSLPEKVNFLFLAALPFIYQLFLSKFLELLIINTNIIYYAIG